MALLLEARLDATSLLDVLVGYACASSQVQRVSRVRPMQTNYIKDQAYFKGSSPGGSVFIVLSLVDYFGYSLASLSASS